MKPQIKGDYRVKNVTLKEHQGKVVKFFEVERAEHTDFGMTVWHLEGVFTAERLVRNDKLLDTVEELLS